MFNISQFFEKFLKLQKNNQLLKDFLRSTIKEISGVAITEENLDLREDKVFLKCRPIVRNQIFMHKENIEKKLAENKIFLKLF